MTNPFMCGTWAHSAWESRTGESNCKKKPIETPRKRRKSKPITLPKCDNIEDFYRLCGVNI